MNVVKSKCVLVVELYVKGVDDDVIIMVFGGIDVGVEWGWVEKLVWVRLWWEVLIDDGIDEVWVSCRLVVMLVCCGYG